MQALAKLTRWVVGPMILVAALVLTTRTAQAGPFGLFIGWGHHGHYGGHGYYGHWGWGHHPHWYYHGHGHGHYWGGHHGHFFHHH